MNNNFSLFNIVFVIFDRVLARKTLNLLEEWVFFVWESGSKIWQWFKNVYTWSTGLKLARTHVGSTQNKAADTELQFAIVPTGS